MKKLAKIFGIILIIFLAVIITVPIVFKDDIKSAIDTAIAENVNANVYYDPDGFGLSLIPNFPNFTFSMSDFGVAGVNEFEGDTLLNVRSFEFIIDVMSVISGEQIAINAIVLDEPKIKVVVLKDGQANYDIAVPAEEAEEPVEQAVEAAVDSSEFSAFSVSIKKWEIINGNLAYDDRSMNVYAKIGGLYHSGSGDFTQDIFDLNTKTKVSQLTTSYEGVNYLNNKTLDMDITLNMDLPNAKYTFKENYVKLNNFGIGIDGYVAMPGEDIDMDISYAGKDISIASILSLIPGVYQGYLEGLDVGGEISFSGNAKGTYNDKSLPTVTAQLDIADGRIKYEEYPIPIEKINMNSSLHVPGEDMNAMIFDMPLFSLLLDDEQMSANLHFENLNNYTWDFGFDGNLDIEKMLKVVPVEGMNLRGKVNAKFKTSGNMRLVEEEKYEEIPAEGSLNMTDFYFESAGLPQGFGINETKLTFTPKKIALERFDATLGKSDMQMNGSLSNFIGFALSEDQILKGNLDFNSNQFDLNEWMTEEDSAAVTAVPEEVKDTTLEVVRLPTNIDFVLRSKIRKILYDSMQIEDLDGLITIRNGVARLNKVDFHMLDGDFVMDGGYNSVPDHPLYDFGFSIAHLSISKSVKTFNTMEKLVPVAKSMSGKFSSDFTLAGSLDAGMMPNYDDMSGKGLAKLEGASIQGEKIMKAIALVTKSDKDTIDISNTKITFEIKNGRIYVDPYQVDYQGREATISGSNGFDGSIDYNIRTEVPTGAAGDAVNNFLAQYTGGQSIVGDAIPVTINVSGTYDDPKVGLGKSAGGGKSNSTKDAASVAAKAELEKQKKLAEEKARAELAKQKQAAEEKAKAELEKQKQELARKKAEAEAKAKAELEKQKKIAEEKAKKEAEEKAKKAVNSLFKK